MEELWPEEGEEVGEEERLGGEEREKAGRFPKMETYHSNLAIYRNLPHEQ
jgi:hypothetical protein